MYIKNIKLHNFRGIKDLSINFDKNINVIVGVNGIGKTSILDACAIVLSDFIRKITKSKSSLKFEDKDIYNLEFSSSINASFELENPNLQVEGGREISLHKTKKGKISLTKDDTTFFKLLSDKLLADINDNVASSIPIFAYYQTHRALLDIPLRIRKSHLFSALESYDRSLNGDANFRLFFEWFRMQDELENEKIVNVKGISKDLEKDIAKVEDSLILLARLVSLSKDFDHNLKEYSSEKKAGDNDVKRILEEINTLKVKASEAKNDVEKKQINYHNIVADSKNYNNSVEFKAINYVRKAIEEFIPYIHNIRITRNPLSMVAEKNDIEIHIEQLSQGEKILISMIGDIARRLVIANQGIKNPLMGEGIILIDEIELHLHPQWQSEVVKKLKKTFPNCQFILTTHSPQVIREVEKESIFLLSIDSEKNASVINPKRTIGLDSSNVLSEIMNTLTINEEFERKLSTLYSNIDKEKYDKARKLLTDLQNEYSDVPEIIKARNFINFMED